MKELLSFESKITAKKESYSESAYCTSTLNKT